jgi:phosphate transport system protein
MAHNPMLERAESGLRDQLVELADAVDRALVNAITSLSDIDAALARDVIEADAEIDALHRHIEESCVIIIASKQPMARDLRELVANLNVSAELERIADYAKAIARIVVQMEADSEMPLLQTLCELAEKCRILLQDVMSAYVTHDAAKAREVAAQDDDIDAVEGEINTVAFELMRENPQQIETGSRLMWIGHHLERIGDRITNIAERVVFITTGNHVDLN